MGHLRDKNTTYCIHMRQAFNYGFRALCAGIVLIIHSLIPDVFTETGSRMLKDITFDIDTANIQVRLYGETKKGR